MVEGSGEEEGVEETVVGGGGVEVVGRENLGEGVREESRFLDERVQKDENTIGIIIRN